MRQILNSLKSFLLVIALLGFHNLLNAQVLHIDYVQTSGTNTSFSVDVYVSKTSPEPMLLSALNTVFTYPSGALTAGSVTGTLTPPFNTLQTLQSSYITAQLKIRSTQVPSGSPATSINVTSTPQLFGTMFVTSTSTISYPVNITPATSGNPTVQAIVYHDGSPNSVALTLVGGTITIDENPLTLQLLPIKLHNFSAEKAGERRAKLNWSSSSEINSSYYEIQRSEDAENFEKIGEVKAAGTSQSLLKYEFYDSNIPSLRSNTIVYYRLKMVDLDGSFEYSDIRGLNFSRDGLTGVHMYPNPTNQMLNVEISNLDFEESGSDLRVFDRDGRLVMNKNVIGTGIETLDMGRLTPGVYQVLITRGDQVFTEKIIRVD